MIRQCFSRVLSRESPPDWTKLAIHHNQYIILFLICFCRIRSTRNTMTPNDPSLSRCRLRWISTVWRHTITYCYGILTDCVFKIPYEFVKFRHWRVEYCSLTIWAVWKRYHSRQFKEKYPNSCIVPKMKFYTYNISLTFTNVFILPYITLDIHTDIKNADSLYISITWNRMLCELIDCKLKSFLRNLICLCWLAYNICGV